MSRIGKALIKIPTGVTVEVKDGGEFGNKEVAITGPKGTLTQSIRAAIDVVQEGETIKLVRANEAKQTKAYHGLYRALLNNMVLGVTAGFSRELEIVGIGYRAEDQGGKIVFSLGFAHRIEYVPPAGVTVAITDQTQIVVSGIDIQKVGEAAAKIRGFREPEPYKGKGIRYKDEQVRRKSVKKAA